MYALAESRSLGVDFTVTGIPRAFGPRAKEVVEELHIPESLLPFFLAKHGKVASGFDYSMLVKLAAYPSSMKSASPGDGQQHQVLTADEHKLIHDFLSDPHASDVIVMIADTGWPDDPAYKESRQYLVQIFDAVRSHFKLGSSSRPSPKPFVEPRNPHCKEIASALQEFRSLDPNHHIKVIYVPLLPEQDSSSLLKELLEINYLQRHLGTNLGLDSAEQLPSDVRSQAKSEAARIVSKLQPYWESDEVRSDESIISAYLSLLNLYSQITQKPSFMSESWTLPNRALTVVYPDPFGGLVVAAAGNENGGDFVVLARDFAGRCARHKDTVAVIGIDQQGHPQCKTSITSNMLNSVMAVGFDGTVNDSVCGTSFATPRVAWLLAVAETKNDVFTASSWENVLYQRLTAGRLATATLQNLWFDTKQFLSGATPGPQ